MNVEFIRAPKEEELVDIVSDFSKSNGDGTVTGELVPAQATGPTTMEAETRQTAKVPTLEAVGLNVATSSRFPKVLASFQKRTMTDTMLFLRPDSLSIRFPITARKHL